jgi:hypothetical protein
LGCVLVIDLFSFGWNPGIRMGPGPFCGMGRAVPGGVTCRRG